ncbi:hypothetical protein J1N35_007564 [Gossypium stocksii]|uniref:Uncharacterized protein n=1 Tax=Gossypium stocksii TaxID=47602 RepID=A0A9D3W6V7_9ROSI|nr:hypothetical protein J1N35_007564 [Gossypium stocksii]
MNFKCLWPLVNTDLGFDVLNPKGVVWRKFQKKWKESSEIFYDHDSNTPNSDSSYCAASEDGTPDEASISFAQGETNVENEENTEGMNDPPTLDNV